MENKNDLQAQQDRESIYRNHYSESMRQREISKDDGLSKLE